VRAPPRWRIKIRSSVADAPTARRHRRTAFIAIYSKRRHHTATQSGMQLVLDVGQAVQNLE
jgi:hypothetical protein